MGEQASFGKTISLHERTAIKLLPIIEEVVKSLAHESSPFEIYDLSEKAEEADMRSILGFLNQNEWVYNLNIGNIM